MHVSLFFDFNDRDLTGFAGFTELIRSLHALQLDPRVTVTGTDGPIPMTPNPAPAPAAPAAGRGGNGRGRRAAAPAAAPDPPPPNPANDTLDDVFGDDPTETDDDLTAGTEAGMSQTEALDRGLTLVRAIYNAGHKKEVKELQQKFAVAKFADVPTVRGHEFFKLVNDLANKTGVHV